MVLSFLWRAPKEAPPATTASESTPKPSPSPTSAPPPHPQSDAQIEPRPAGGFSSRSAKQLGLFFAGASFLALSTLVTRRAVVRKQLAAAPRFYQTSHGPAGGKAGSGGNNQEGSLIAFEALNLATLNVISFGIMATGGLSWAFDFTSVDDLRQMTRRHITGQGGRTDEEAEREIEEWAARVLLGKGKADGGGRSKDEAEDQRQRRD